MKHVNKNHIEKTVRKRDGIKTIISDIDNSFYDRKVARVGVSGMKSSSGKNYRYVICFEKGRNGKQFYLHRAIMERVEKRTLNKSEKVDHIDGNPLNNARENLRICTHTQNMQNSQKRTDGKNKIKGVCFDKTRNKWKVYITANGINYQKRFNTFVEAEEFSINLRNNLHKEFSNHG